MTILQMVRSSWLKDHSRSFPLGYRTGAAAGVLAVVLPAVLLPFIAISAVAQQAKVLHVAAAADLQPVLPTLAAEYERQTGVKIVASYGSSATLTQQIMNGDPQDVFLSADTVHPQQLVTAGQATGLAAYAHGVLVLWARKDSAAQPLAEPFSTDSLTSAKVTKIAVANDLHAPYGLAATSALKALGVYDKVRPKLVMGENIGQTAQFALTGNAQVGLISLTIASSQAYREAGSFVTVPKVYGEIRQSGVVMTESKQQAEGKAFLAWLTSEAVQKRLPGFGLEAVR